MITPKRLLFFSLFLLLSGKALAAHIVGGGITYECLGPSGNGIRYRFTMKVYRDCASNGAQFDNNARIAIYNGSYQDNAIFASFSAPLGDVVEIPLNDPDCIDNLPNLCVQEGSYTWERVLPINNQSYFIEYQRCCRTNAITNIDNPGGTGATYYVEITPAAQQLCNNSPIFNNFPPIVICNNYPLEVDYSATDAEGDLLVYSFCAPFAGGGESGGQGCFSTAPNPPCAPPFDEVIFLGPNYTAAQPMGGNPVISIDPQSGIISGTPQLNGQFVVGVCVEEYRNGQLLSVTRRDFQFNVTDCEPTVTAIVDYDEITSPQHYVIKECSGTKTVTIDNQSISSDSIIHVLWTFDLNNGATLVDSSNFDLTVNFPDFGVYDGTLKLNPNNDCGDLAYIRVEVYPPATLELGPDFKICQDTNIVFDAGTDFVSYAWQDGSNAQTFNATSTGTYFVAATDHCGNVLRDSVFITLGSAPDIQLNDVSICPGQSTTLGASGFAQYAWTPGTGLNCTDCPTVTAQPATSTNYTLLATTQSGCTTTETVHVEVLPTPKQTYVIQFYPNQPVTIGGQTYTQPATVTIPVASTSGGCDSLNTYILELIPTTLSLQCPPNMTVTLPNNANNVVVTYPMPVSTTNCPGTPPTLQLTQGLASGAGFPLGSNTVCYSASNTCGDQANCCFNVMVTTLDIQCPANQTVDLPVAATTVVVNYAAPTTTTNCPNPAITFNLLQGQASGSGFALGANTVCYEAQNTCGNRDTCCFKITVLDAPPPCDIKVIGCMKFELLDIRHDAFKQPRFRIRVTNFCNSEVNYILNELPPGIIAVTPLEGSIYTAPNTGNTYLVRNPNYSPFYSVRYRSISPGLNNGQADVIEHKLPQQSFPNNYIHMFAKLKDGQSFEAYLNTFYCPVQAWNGNKPIDEEGGVEGLFTAPDLSLHPNPSAGLVMVDMEAWVGQNVQLRLFNALGQEVINQAYSIEDEWLELNLDGGISNGLYYLVVQPEGGVKASAVFLLER